MSEEDLNWIIDSYQQIIKTEEKVVYQKRFSDEKYIDRMLVTGDWYYGESKFQFYESSVMRVSFTPCALQCLLDMKNKTKEFQQEEAQQNKQKVDN